MRAAATPSGRVSSDGAWSGAAGGRPRRAAGPSCQGRRWGRGRADAEPEDAVAGEEFGWIDDLRTAKQQRAELERRDPRAKGRRWGRGRADAEPEDAVAGEEFGWIDDLRTAKQ
ncbi:hypothetical protein, partial [Micromonospora sp. ATA51]|uniref:hypothetical protein n=1 Tax=Micromonospora sp. ATA51 TaxID=2806098 RepID=UPI001A46CF72